ncbi:YqgE/AlgH family protein [Corynebacterium accolens]|uniref:YqgE/AlgH family protein n=1 Tax=Corynebacterium accolens TaxID=38284 RepID=A0ABT7FSV4_9CORY|nr:YqgE/AlgH family protein [Corynebacterium accolens]MDK4248487.1 YqgE/AlgH family protein [Corynebacterium accolens]MDK4324015.1 YqgE/AlgH family protein [Corynebacterium accolens]
MFADRLFNALERNDPAPGQLLVSAPGMLSPEFARSVILLVEHNDMMTFGVDLTKRSEVAIFNVLPEWMPVVAKPHALYIGGPLNQQSVVGLAQTKQGVDPDKEEQLNRLAPRLAHVDLRSNPEDIEPLVTGMRMFAGYAEWGPGQLEEEIEAGEWFVAPALAQDVVAPGPADLWADVMKRQPMPLPLYSTYPVNVDDN